MRKSVCLHFAVLLACLFSACAGSSSSKKPEMRRLRMCLSREPQSLDPRKGAEVVSTALHFLLFEGLTRFNADWTVSLSLASSVDISEDKKTYFFHLRDAYWSDGVRVTSHDFVYAWKKILDPAFPSPNAHLFYPIKNAESAKRGFLSSGEIGVYAIDDATLKVELEKPTPYFLQLTAFAAFFPVSIAEDTRNPNWPISKDEKGDVHFVSNGPFTLSSWQSMQKLTLTRNPHYWDKEKIALDAIEFLLISDGMTALQLFEKNELDLIQASLCPLPADCISFLRNKEEFYTEPTSGSAIIAFNAERYPFQNAKLRRAISLALNRKSIIENITQLGEEPATGAVPPILKNHVRHDLFKDGVHEEAQALFGQALEELGISSTQELPVFTYLYSSSDINKKTAETIQMQLFKTLGINIQLQSMEHCCMFSLLGKRNFDMVQTAWIAQYNDPMNILERFKTRDNAKNYSGWEDPLFCSLLERSSFETGEERLKTLLEAEKRLIEEMPVIPLYHLNASFLKKSYVKNLISPYSSNLCYAWIEKRELLHENIEYALRGTAQPVAACPGPGGG